MNEKRIAEIERQLTELPAGYLVYKNIKGKAQPYLQWTENGRTVSKYIKIAEREEVFRKITLKKSLQEELKKLRAMNLSTAAAGETTQTEAVSFRTHVLRGNELLLMTSSVKEYQKRDCFPLLCKYMKGSFPGKVCLLYGLRRTGKTTLLFQMINDLSPEELSRAVYIKARTTDSMADMNHDLKLLASYGYRYVFLDEVTLMDDFIDGAALFSDVYAMMRMKIILSGTDSLGFWFTLSQELYDRAFLIHTTYIPFHEYARVLGIRDLDEYICYGGTLRLGETDFDDEDLLSPEASFRDDESTRRYIDTAICRNIQHSLACCKDGEYFRHLRELYEAGELTGAINRIIESMNHQFLISTLTRAFKSHDLGSAAELLRKQADPEKRTDILDRIDREAITRKLMEMLEIRNREDQTIGITKVHVEEIKEYLKALDLVVDLPSETAAADSIPSEYAIFTQPGMRYSQAQALVHVLMKDPPFSSFSLRERDLACERILEDVRGRMMEDLVLLETSRSLPKERRAFKLILARTEFDMLIVDKINYTCEAYEIKHSPEAVSRQYRTLLLPEECAAAENIYGPITRKCVIYRGKSQHMDNGIEYMNVEEYLEKL